MQTELGTTFVLFYVTLGLILLINMIIMLYIKRLQDERYVHILSIAGRNAFVFLMIGLPILSALQFLGLPWIETGCSSFVLWISSLVVFYMSSYYYYRN
ncbi:MAG: hypothetical protein ACXAAO_02260 [Candidatus Thorarchaeota archaeon]|jgi:hypothetical protein